MILHNKKTYGSTVSINQLYNFAKLRKCKHKYKYTVQFFKVESSTSQPIFASPPLLAPPLPLRKTEKTPIPLYSLGGRKPWKPFMQNWVCENEESNLVSEVINISTSFLVNSVRQSNLFLAEYINMTYYSSGIFSFKICCVCIFFSFTILC